MNNVTLQWQEDILTQAFSDNGMALTQRQAQQLCEYGRFLQEKNQETNLTAITDTQGIIEKHFIDSGLVAEFLPQDATLCDIGCGAGFPSVVAKILRPDVKITAVDSVGKKTNFVKELLARIEVDGEVVNARAEQLVATNREFYDVVCARAVANLVTLLEYLAPLAKVGGIVLAQKGKDGMEELQQAEYCAKILGLQLSESKSFCLPNGDQRIILVYKKVSATPAKYPRPQNAPRKNPLVATADKVEKNTDNHAKKTKQNGRGK